MSAGELSDKSRAILKAIAEGHSYDQMLSSGLGSSYHDIFQAAAEALNAAAEALNIMGYATNVTAYDQRVAAIRQRHPHAYEPWSTEEERQLTALFGSGKTLNEIAEALQR